MLALKLDDEVVFEKEAYFKYTGYAPHQAQKEVHESTGRFRVVVAGRRWGKSLMAAREIEPVLMLPGRRVWIVAPVYDLTDKVFREVWDSLILKQGLPTERKSDRERIIKFVWGATLEGKSAENPDSLVGEGLDLLVIDEAAKIKREIWEKYLRPTLTDRQGAALFISTPEGYNWFYQIYLRGQDPAHPEWESFQFPSWASPYLAAKEIEEAKRVLANETFAQEYGAQFTTFTGRVYKEFNRSVHVIEPFAIPESWRRFRSIDFGYTNPFVCLFLAVDEDENVYIYDEHYQAGKLTDYHLAEIMRRSGNFQASFCDPSARQLIEDMRARSLSLTPADHELRSGIEAVREKLKIKEDGRPSLFVLKGCLNTIFEFEQYRYPETKGDGNDREEPLKLNDHAMDALRYALAALKRPAAVSLGREAEPGWYEGARRSLWHDLPASS